MKLTKDNIKDLPSGDNKNYIGSLIDELYSINKSLAKHGYDKLQLYIDCQDFHDSYSDERTDPCPDYYGMYRIYISNEENEPLTSYIDINGLDDILYTLNRFIECLIDIKYKTT